MINNEPPARLSPVKRSSMLQVSSSKKNTSRANMKSAISNQVSSFRDQDFPSSRNTAEKVKYQSDIRYSPSKLRKQDKENAEVLEPSNSTQEELRSSKLMESIH